MSDRAEVSEPRILSRSEHSISRQHIDKDALSILYRLHRSGFKAYLVGGGVRDLMLGIAPKDFDIATDARPNRLKKIFRNCRIIGRRFRLAHLHYPGDKIIEVATFRSSSESDAIVREGELIRRDNVYGTPREDAQRRDLTINALFYNIADFSVIDYVGGVDDLRSRTVRTIADPTRSFREDPVRLLRTIRHATRLDFTIEEQTRRALVAEREQILKANPTRLLEELYRDLASGRARPFFEALHHYRILGIFAPELVDSFRRRSPRSGKALLIECLDRLDRRVAENGEVTHAMSLAVLCSPLVLPVARELETGRLSPGHPPWQRFVKVLSPVFRNLRVYRRDEDRLWHALGAWPRVAQAFARGNVPAALARRQYFHEAVEIYGLLEEGGDELSRFVEGVRSVEPQPGSEDEPRRPGRRRRRGGRRRTATSSSRSRSRRKGRRRSRKESDGR